MNDLVILNDPPYGTERSFNGFRLAQQLVRHEDVTLHVFLMAHLDRVRPWRALRLSRAARGGE